MARLLFRLLGTPLVVAHLQRLTLLSAHPSILTDSRLTALRSLSSYAGAPLSLEPLSLKDHLPLRLSAAAVIARLVHVAILCLGVFLALKTKRRRIAWSSVPFSNKQKQATATENSSMHRFRTAAVFQVQDTVSALQTTID